MIRLLLPASLTLPLVFAGAQTADRVNGNLIQFEPNGGWSWYQDERAIVDAESGTIVVGSVANRFGFDGGPIDGNVQATFFEIATGQRTTFVLRSGLTSYGAGDDHNLPAFLRLPDGDYLALYAGHNNNNLTWFRTYDAASETWREERAFDWNTIPGGTNFPVTYSNLFHLSDEAKIYNISRTRDRSPNLIVSTDLGKTWTYGGQLTQAANVGYVNGYFKYADNGADRIDFVATEHHPRDFNNSLYHGYIRDGASFDSHGKRIDSDILDRDFIPTPADFTRIFAADTVVADIRMTRCWNIDVESYADGTLGVLFKARADDRETEHHFFHARFDGDSWQSTRLANAGPNLFPSEQDYTGLGALDPNDPDTLYLSTPFHPATNAPLDRHEIFKGVTRDHGETWTWTSITENSTYDNLRPIVPAWDENNTVLLWLRGTMTSSQNYDFAVVGILDRHRERPADPRYLDARPDNTAPVDPDGDRPSTDEVPPTGWTFRTDIGHGGNLFAAGETASTATRTLRTRATGLNAGTYDVWVYFRATPEEAGRIRAGLRNDRLQTYRLRGAQAAPPDHPAASGPRASEVRGHLYQAWLGRVPLAEGEPLDVYIRSPENPASNGAQRTWYEGIGYAPVR